MSLKLFVILFDFQQPKSLFRHESILLFPKRARLIRFPFSLPQVSLKLALLKPYRQPKH